MIPIAPDAAVATKRSVDGARDSDRESTDPTRESSRAVAFDDQVQMIVLHAELNDPEAAIGSADQRGADCGEDVLRAEAGKRGSERHVDGMRGAMRWADAVRDARTTTGRELTARTRSAAAPSRSSGQRELKTPGHVDWAVIAL